MISKLFDKTFWKFIIVGVINTAFGSGIMFLFYNLFHFDYWVSSASNYIFGSILSFFLNKHFTFQNRDKSSAPVFKFILNIAVCYLVAYGAARPLVFRLLSGYSQKVRDNVAMAIGMGLFVGMNYLGQRFFVFRSDVENN